MNRNLQSRLGWGGAAGLVFAATALVVPGDTVSAERRGDCVTVTVPSEMSLPDGTERPAGQLRICLTEKLSPVAGLHVTYVDGRAVGVFVSKMGRSEGRAVAGETDALVQFRRTRNGTLALSGYAIPEGERMIVFRMADAPGVERVATVHGGSIILAARRTP